MKSHNQEAHHVSNLDPSRIIGIHVGNGDVGDQCSRYTLADSRDQVGEMVSPSLGRIADKDVMPTNTGDHPVLHDMFKRAARGLSRGTLIITGTAHLCESMLRIGRRDND